MKESTFPTRYFFLFLIFFVVSAGNGHAMNTGLNLEKEKQAVLEKDCEISRISAANGVLRAFYPFITDKSILLPKTGHPLQGKETCSNLINRLEMDGRENLFKWEPLFADVSSTGDLAYTHGRYELPPANINENNPAVNYGYYGTIWKKDTEGSWKVAFSQGLILLKGLQQKPLEKQFNPGKLDPITREVVDTEKAFSDYSVTKGQLAAFYQYMDDNGIVLGTGGDPKSKQYFAGALEKKRKENQTSPGKLEWEPLYSYVAASGDMAYDYGTYLYTPAKMDDNAKVSRGYFLTVWKKEKNAKDWKFVFDCGNDVE
ncbi:MAG: nuclear transport factor 2 family protein [Acidobacteria bacterium]|nr:nuclear transport factor 2 family protein [Acidobacteriota bacterium]